MNLPGAVDDYVELLRSRTPYAQANYGDGEWACAVAAGYEPWQAQEQRVAEPDREEVAG